MTYNTVGHCFFLEDGIEHGNQFVHNLAIQIKCHTDQGLRADQSRRKRREQLYVRESRGLQGRPACPARTPCCLRTTRWRLTGSPIRTTPSSTTWQRVPMRMASGCRCRNTRKGSSKVRRSARPPGRVEPGCAEFRGNVAHSNFDGFMFDRNINVENIFGLAGPSYMPKENPADPNSKSVESLFENLTATRTAMAASGAAASCTSSGI